MNHDCVNEISDTVLVLLLVVLFKRCIKEVLINKVRRCRNVYAPVMSVLNVCGGGSLFNRVSFTSRLLDWNRAVRWEK
jgi:hypothetical protein